MKNKIYGVAASVAMLTLLPVQQAQASGEKPVIGPRVATVQQDWASYPNLMLEEVNSRGQLPALKAQATNAKAKQVQAQTEASKAKKNVDKVLAAWPGGAQAFPKGDARFQEEARVKILEALFTSSPSASNLLDGLQDVVHKKAVILDTLTKAETIYTPKAEALTKANQALATATTAVKNAEAKVNTLAQARAVMVKRINDNLLAAVASDRGVSGVGNLMKGTNTGTLSPVAWAQLSSPLCTPVAMTANNGLIPDNGLCYIGNKKHMLRPEAARSYVALATAYAEHFKEPMCITDSYRPLSAQISLKARKPFLAARPGTSNHGWGMAVDLCGGIEKFGTPQHQWLAENALAYGFYHPQWAEPNGSKPEPWHWEFIGTSGA